MEEPWESQDVPSSKDGDQLRTLLRAAGSPS
jgi:hypothetical protein